MVYVRKLRRRTGRLSSSAEKTPRRAESAPISTPTQISPPIFQNAPSPQIDFTDSFHSPFTLSNGDNPGNTIISEVLDGTNYSSWQIAMTVALDAKNKLAFVDGSLPRPHDLHPMFRIWSRCNSMVKSWLLTSVTKQIYKSILRFNDASEIWKDLMKRFHITNIPRSYSLSQQIWSLQQGSMELSEYYTTLKTLWDDLDGADCVVTCHNCTCCKVVDKRIENAKIIKFLAGLNESYAAIRSSIIMKKTIPDLAEIYNLLDQDHSQRNFGSSYGIPSNTSAFNVSVAPTEQFSVNAAHTAYHNNPRQNKIQCSHCGYVGHTVDKCYRIHGYPPGFKHKVKVASDKQTSTSSVSPKPVVASLTLSNTDAPVKTGLGNNDIAQLVAGMSTNQIQDVIAYFSTHLQPEPTTPITVASTSSACDINGDITGSYTNGIAFSSSTFQFIGILTATKNVLTSQTWIVDSGATHHVSHDINLFESLSTNLCSSVTLPTGSNVKIEGVGVIKLTTHITIKNVLYIPAFRINLLSVSQMTKELKTRVSFDEHSCVIQDHSREQMIGKGKEIAGLYVLDTATLPSHPSAVSPFCSSVVIDATLWHSRLGHPSYVKLDTLKSVLGFQKSNKDTSHCDICQLSKQKHLTFPSKNNICNTPFELVHIDTWGPFSVPTLEGYRYFLTIVDDHSRATWVYLMKTKSEAIQVFPVFLQMVETQFQCKVRSVRSDNAPELKFTEIFKQKGIVAYHSCPETPEQNSVVERKHQHILNVARALMFQSHVPLHFWGDCVLSAVFLINRLPSPLLSNKSPFELLNSKVPDYSLIRVFGCLCYQSTSPHQRHKFAPRARACVFLGYPAGYKGYKVLDLESNSIHISRHVVFFEHLFPFADPSKPLDDVFDISEPVLQDLVSVASN